MVSRPWEAGGGPAGKFSNMMRRNERPAGSEFFRNRIDKNRKHLLNPSGASDGKGQDIFDFHSIDNN